MSRNYLRERVGSWQTVSTSDRVKNWATEKHGKTRKKRNDTDKAKHIFVRVGPFRFPCDLWSTVFISQSAFRNRQSKKPPAYAGVPTASEKPRLPAAAAAAYFPANIRISPLTSVYSKFRQVRRKPLKMTDGDSRTNGKGAYFTKDICANAWPRPIPSASRAW